MVRHYICQIEQRNYMRKLLLLPFASLLFGGLAYSEAAAETKAPQAEIQPETLAGWDKPKLSIDGEAAASFCASNTHNTYRTKEVKDNLTADENDRIKSDKDTNNPRIASGEAKINFKVAGIAPNDWIYNARFQLYAMRDDTNIDKMYVDIGRWNFGTLYVGSLKGPEDTFQFGAQQLVGGTTCLDGVVCADMDFATGVIQPIALIGNSGKASKIFYVTPEYNGFQAGIAYTPDTAHFGHNYKNRRAGAYGAGNDSGVYEKVDGVAKEKPSGTNNLSIGFRHIKEWNHDWTTMFGAAAIFEKGKKIRTTRYYVNSDVTDPYTKNGYLAGSTGDTLTEMRNSSAFLISGSIKYKKFTLGLTYMDNGKSRLPKDSAYDLTDAEKTAHAAAKTVNLGGFISTKYANAGKVFNVAGRYELDDKWALSGIWYHTKRKVTQNGNARMNAFGLTADYRFAKGLLFYGEIDYVRSKADKSVCDLYNGTRITGVDPADMSNADFKKAKAISKTSSWLFVIGMKVTF